MATDIATLAIKVENGDVLKATTSLNSMAVAGGKTEAAAQRLTRRMALLEIEARKADAAMLSSANTARAATVAFVALGAAAVGIAIGRKIIAESIEAQAAVAQLNAAIKSTGGAAGLSSRELQEMASHVQDVSTFSDEAATRMHALLLTFTSVKGDNFKAASAAIIDMSVAMTQDLQTSAVQVGKALNDPIQGVSALQRVGVRFSASQKEVIKDLVNTGRTAEAQRMILKELTTEFGGSAAAARNTLGGALTHLKNVWGDLFEVSGKGSNGLRLAIDAVAAALPRLREGIDTFVVNTIVGFNNMSAAWQKFVAFMEIPIDVAKNGLGGAPKRFQDELQRIREEQAAANALARGGGAADDGPLGSGKGGAGGGLTEEARKFAALVAQRQQEIGKLKALNAAYGQSDLALQILGIRYDATIEKSKNASDHHGRELAILNQLTEAIAKQKIVQAQLADQKEREARVREAQGGDADAVRNARQALELAGLSDEAASHRRIDMQAENELAAARRQFAVETLNLTDETDAKAIKAAQDIYQSAVRRIGVEREIGHVIEEVNKRRQAAEFVIMNVARKASDAIFGALEALGQKGRNIFQEWWDAGKRGLNRFIADIVGAKIGDKFGAMLGVGMGGAAAKQVAASSVMLQAAQLQVAAANAMITAAGGAPIPGGTPGAPGGAAAGSSRFGALAGWATLVGGSALSGYNAGQATASSSHGAAGNYVRGGLGGAAAGALTGAAIGSVVPVIGTAIGAVVGGLVGLVAGLKGTKEALDDMSAAALLARQAVAATMDALKATAGKDTVASGIAQINAERTQIAKSIEDAYSGGGKNSDTVRKRNELLRELNKLEDERIEQLKREAAVLQARTVEDYQARAAEATPGNEKQEARDAFDRKQRREREDLITSFGPEIDAREAATLAALDQALAAEKEKYAREQATSALSAFTTAVRNAPTGFKLASYIQDYATASSMPGHVPINPFAPPMDARPSIPATSSRTSATSAPITFHITINESETPELTADVVTRMVVGKIDESRSGMGGLPNMTRSAALERMKGSSVLRS